MIERSEVMPGDGGLASRAGMGSGGAAPEKVVIERSEVMPGDGALASRAGMGSGGAAPEKVVIETLPSGELPAEAFVAALASLESLSPRRLKLLLHDLSPRQAWLAIVAGRLVVDPDHKDARRLVGVLRSQAASIDPARVWARHRAAGISISIMGSPDYPAALVDDPWAPAVIFSRGRFESLQCTCVAVVGTRNATAAGIDVAFDFGRGLAASGVAVVSGLARGIDAAAHRGALAADGGAAPVGVVGSGLDVVYPIANRALWADVGRVGLLLAEVPAGTAPKAFRFPARNRIIAGLVDAVLVVESKQRGGSLLTVGEADRRAVPVLAVPGSIRNAASEGTNRLIANGAVPALDVDDVLMAVGLGRLARAAPVGWHLDSDDRRLVELIGTDGLTFDSLVERSGRPIVDVARALGRLEDAGAVDSTGGTIRSCLASGRAQRRR